MLKGDVLHSSRVRRGNPGLSCQFKQVYDMAWTFTARRADLPNRCPSEVQFSPTAEAGLARQPSRSYEQLPSRSRLSPNGVSGMRTQRVKSKFLVRVALAHLHLQDYGSKQRLSSELSYRVNRPDPNICGHAV